jgi:hypothetical protein
MRMTIALRVLVAVLLLGGAALARNEARLARAEAGAWQQLATLRYDAPPPEAPPAWQVLPVSGGGTEAAHRREATVGYWLGRYDELVEQSSGDADPDVLFVAANAAFRAARRERPVGPEAARQLDAVLQAYTTVLRAQPGHADAAYNYEYVVRLRDRIAPMKPVPARKDDEGPRGAGNLRTTDLPTGATVHGWPGGPPPDIKTEEFEIITPMDFGDREAQPEQTAGGKLRRKG